jgi:translation elongation factor EF-Tu-like GTPase
LFVGVIAQINFFQSEMGGRNVPFGQGFSPKLILNASDVEYFTELNIKESMTIFPGDQIKLELKIKSAPNILMHKGASFDLFEREKNIGNGTILKII